MDKRLFTERAFLNKGGYHSNASLVATITDSEYGTGFYATYKLTDCSRSVELSIDLDDLDEYENTLSKLQTIIDITKSFKDHVVSLKPALIASIEKEKKEEEERKAEAEAKKES